MNLEDFYAKVRRIAYAGDCDECGVSDELLDLCAEVEASGLTAASASQSAGPSSLGEPSDERSR